MVFESLKKKIEGVFADVFDEPIRLNMQKTFAYSRWIRNIYNDKSDEELQRVVNNYWITSPFSWILDEIAIFPSKERIEYTTAKEILQRRSLDRTAQ